MQGTLVGRFLVKFLSGGLFMNPVVDGFVSLSLENKIELKKYIHSGSETGI